LLTFKYNPIYLSPTKVTTIYNKIKLFMFFIVTNIKKHRESMKNESFNNIFTIGRITWNRYRLVN
jgi:hypothetical protein